MEYDLCQRFKNLGYYLLIPIQTVTTLHKCDGVWEPFVTVLQFKTKAF